MTTPSSKKRLIAVTMGDPAGIGPEIALKAVHDPRVLAKCRPVLIGNLKVLSHVADKLKLTLPDIILKKPTEAASLPVGSAALLNIPTPGLRRTTCGHISRTCALAAYSYIDLAARQTLRGNFAAMTTGPIHKEALKAAGINHPGHTEILAHLCRSKRYCMMMYSPRITVGLVTTHVALGKVPGLITPDKIQNTVELTREALSRILKRQPRLGVCSLNPHGGEGGMFGRTDLEIIQPAVEACRRQGALLDGPLPPDTAFTPASLKSHDGFIVMYHDQGLIPFKMLSFDRGVNVTLGLPIVRTSVDHGTAFDIARRGIADHRSMVEAILLAAKLVRKK